MSSLPTRRTIVARRTVKIAQAAFLEKAKAGELEKRSGQQLVASLGENDGWLTASSSPHFMWLATQLAKGGRR